MASPPPPRPAAAGLRVTIIGAGIAGLATAAMLRTVPGAAAITLYERRPEATARVEPSAALGLWADGVAALRQLGLTARDVAAVQGAGVRSLDRQGHEQSRTEAPGGAWFVFRADLRDALERAALGGVGGGQAEDKEEEAEAEVRIEYGKKVVAVDVEEGVVWFEDGTRAEADLVVGADGIRSTIRATVAPSHPAPEPCGLSMYRFVLPSASVHATLAAAASTATGPVPPVYDAPDAGGAVFVTILAAGDAGNRNIVTYPCRDGTLINFACALPDGAIRDREARPLQYSWSARGDPAAMAAQFADFGPPGFGAVLRQAPADACALFQLHDQAPLASYVAGRVALVGDAAHAMVPYKAQGANQALLDAAALRRALVAATAAAGNKETATPAAAAVPDALRAWDAERRPRASEIQRASRVSQQKLASREASQAVVG